VPEGRPAGRDPLLLLRAGADEVADRLQPGRPQVRPVGVRALDRVAEDHDELHVRDRLGDPGHRRLVVEVERRGLAAQRPGRGGVEERLVPVELPDVLAVGQGVTGAALGRRRAVGEEELRFLDRRQEQAGMPGERGVQRGGPRLGNSGHQEVRKRHRLSFAAQGRRGWVAALTTFLVILIRNFARGQPARPSYPAAAQSPARLAADRGDRRDAGDREAGLASGPASRADLAWRGSWRPGRAE
jgi:hypothetical protein